MKKNFMKITFLLILLMTIIATTVIYANTTRYATVIYSDNMGGFLDEQEEAYQHALDTYQTAGYGQILAFEPTEFTLRSNMLMNNILVIASHGSPDAVTLDNTGLITGPARYYDEVYHPSINEFDWTQRKMVVLCACKTGGDGEPYDLSITARIADAGAGVSIGWYDTIFTFSTPNWLNNFHDALESGDDTLEAVTYAGEFTYGFPSVKKVYYCYNEIESIYDNSFYNTAVNNNIINLDRYSRESSDQNIESLIKKYDKDFERGNYERIETEGIYLRNVKTGETTKHTSYIDYYYSIGDYRINSGYTVVLDKNDSILKIVDNTKEFDYEELATKLINNISTSKKIDDENILNKNYYYDIDTDKKYVEIEYLPELNKNKEVIEID